MTARTTLERGARKVDGRLSRDREQAWYQRLSETVRSTPFIVSAVLTLVYLPLGQVVPRTGVDPSWQLGLSLVHVRGIEAGPGFVFTYGPLGFLGYPNIVWPTGATLALFYVIGVTFCLFYLLFQAARGWLPTVAAVLVSVAFAQLATGLVGREFFADYVAIAAVLAGFAVLQPRVVRSALPVWIPALYGAIAALQLLVKFGTGLVLIGVGVSVCLGRPRRSRNAGCLAASLLGTCLLLWLAAQQSPGNLLKWVRDSVQVAIGYSSAQSIPAQDARLWIPLGALLGVIVAGSFGLARIDRSRAIPSLVLAGFASWSFTKEGFTRLDSSHAEVAFLGLAAIIIAIPWNGRARVLGLCGLLIAAAAAIGAESVSSAPSRVWNALQPSHGILEVARVLRSDVDASYRRSELREARQSIQATYGVPPGVVAALREGEVHAPPTEISAVWGYRLAWRPVPVFQTYSAYTLALDDLNAYALVRGGPNRVLWQVDGEQFGRFGAWESPEYMMRLSCAYAVREQSRRWKALVRVADHCGSARFIRQVVSHRGEPINVPPVRHSGDIMAASIRYPISASDRIATFLLKPPTKPSVVVNEKRFEFISGTASQLHLLRVPQTIDGHRVVNAGLDVRTLRFPDASGPVTVRFYELPID
jgi:hypothetical protein